MIALENLDCQNALEALAQWGVPGVPDPASGVVLGYTVYLPDGSVKRQDDCRTRRWFQGETKYVVTDVECQAVVRVATFSPTAAALAGLALVGGALTLGLMVYWVVEFHVGGSPQFHVGGSPHTQNKSHK